MVVALDHEGSNYDLFLREGPPGLGAAMLDRNNVVLRAGDVAFVLDKLPPHVINDEKIAVVGHSYGSFLAMALAGAVFEHEGNPWFSLKNNAITAVVAMSPQGVEDRFFGLHEGSWNDIQIPTLTLTGTLDAGSSGQDWTWRMDPFTHIPHSSKHAAVITDAGHNAFYEHPPLLPGGKPPVDPRWHGWIEELSIRFLRGYVVGYQNDIDWFLNGPYPEWISSGETVLYNG